MSEDFDLVVVGSGPAGEKGAAQAAYHGKRVAIVEQAPTPGGIAVSTAGIPTKTLRETVLYLSGFRNREVYGLGLTLDRRIALERLRTRESEVVSLMTRAVEHNIARHGIHLVQGRARLGPGRTVRVSAPGHDDRTLRAGIILLATGSHPVLPAGVPLADPDVHDPVQIVGLDRIPRSLLVVGGGAVGCEYASIFAALGVAVTLVTPGTCLLRQFDAEIAQQQAEIFRNMGMRLVLDSPFSAVRRVGAQLEVTVASGEAFRADKVLFAMGRAGNTEGLGLEAAGVATSAQGDIVVDEHYRTTAPGIYAAGDVIGPPRLASVSMEQARVAICHAFGICFKDTVDALAPYCVYSIPEIAMVGMTEAQAGAAGLDYETGRAMFSANAKAKISGFHEGLIKLVFRRADHVLLGVHVLGELASELIHLGQLVLHERGPIDRFIHATFGVPTRSEAYKYAAYDGLTRLELARGPVTTARSAVGAPASPVGALSS
jgi:NAD(P) transhydrogenase